MRKLTLATMFLIIFGLAASSCLDSNPSTVNSLTQSKASSTLLLQIPLRQVQLASPTLGRLIRMQARGLNTANLGIQRVYIYVNQQLTPTQASELQTLGIIVYLDSWIPPAGNNPHGFHLADMPVNELDAVAAKDYVVRLDTAEAELNLQSLNISS